MRIDGNALFDSVKTIFKELLPDDDPDINMDVLVKSYIITINEELDLYSVIGTIPFFISDGNYDFAVFIDIKPNGNVVILSIEKILN